MVNLIHKKEQKQKKNDDKDEKALNELTNNAIYEKRMKNGHPNQATCHRKCLTMISWEFVKQNYIKF